MDWLYELAGTEDSRIKALEIEVLDILRLHCLKSFDYSIVLNAHVDKAIR